MGPKLGHFLESVVYRACGAPLAVRRLRRWADDDLPPDKRAIRDAYLATYFRVRSPEDLAALVLAVAIWPVAVPLSAVWMTARNGQAVQRRTGKTMARQWLEQI